MNQEQKNKVAIVTGAGKGIGRAIAISLAKQGMDIVLGSRTQKDLEQVAKEIESLGRKALPVICDVSKEKDVSNLISIAVSRFPTIDLLVNNAAIQGPVGRLWQNNVKEWEKTIQINLLGVFYISHLVIPYMLKQKSGRIINLSGGGAAYARPLFSAYSCSKTAILRLTETLAEELKGKNVQVFALAPGATWTEMTKEAMQKSIKIKNKKNLDELKMIQASGGTSNIKHEKAASYLLSEDSKKLSGKLLHVDEIDKIQKTSFKMKQDSGKLRRVDY